MLMVMPEILDLIYQNYENLSTLRENTIFPSTKKFIYYRLSGIIW